MSNAQQMVRVSGALLIVALVAGCTSARTAPGAGFEPIAVASVQEIMDVLVIPTSADLWDVARTPPADEAGWSRLERASVLLAEAGNLLLVDGRILDDDVWKSTSRSLTEAGGAALRAVRAKDVEAVIEAGNALVDSCEICHESHL